jgi:hypothetical protein
MVLGRSGRRIGGPIKVEGAEAIAERRIPELLALPVTGCS